jgi:hypothetical protein
MTTNTLITRASIEDIARRRDDAIEAFRIARRMQAEAQEQLSHASKMLNAAAPFARNFHLSREESAAQSDRAYIDAKVWDSLIVSTELNQLMDKQAKDEFRKQMVEEPPEFSADNAYATLEKFAGEAGMIFRRGIAPVNSLCGRRRRVERWIVLNSRHPWCKPFAQRAFMAASLGAIFLTCRQIRPGFTIASS